jgi:AraC family transcriptional regulator
LHLLLQLLCGLTEKKFLAKIAAELERALAQRAINGGPGRPTSRRLAQGTGWAVDNVLCTSGSNDRAFEEQHSWFSVAMVAAGSFQYRSGAAGELMTPGMLLLGNAGQWFECGHEHGAGDRCVAFRYAPDYFEQLAADAGKRGAKPEFPALRLPPLQAMSPLTAQACADLLVDSAQGAWEELSIKLAAKTVQLASGISPGTSRELPSAVARVTRAVRAIERDVEARLSLGTLAREAGLSPYHFLRTFERLTGMTPHRYVLRARLREAAVALVLEPAKVLDVALACGFGDVSNFNRAFRAEFGVRPREYRRMGRGRDAA